MNYVLITPARNEAAFIEQTIQAVIQQTIKPVKWVIVSDGSTDDTDNIVRRYLSAFPWIELLRMPGRAERHFGGKAQAFNSGYDRVRGMVYDLIGNLDADISFGPDYFEFLISKFAEIPNLGVAGTPFTEGTYQYDYRFSRKEHVSGACQLFRRRCFDSIGGYIPRKEGGIDLAAVVTARMIGWKTESFTEKTCVHHRPMGRVHSRFARFQFRSGYGDYVFGVHPAWQTFRSIYQMKSRPYVISGLLLWAGYGWAWLTDAPKPVSDEFVRFRRREQWIWLKDYYLKVLKYLD